MIVLSAPMMLAVAALISATGAAIASIIWSLRRKP